VDEATILSVALKDASLEEALQVVTKEFGLAYTWVEGQVVLHYPEGGKSTVYAERLHLRCRYR
jgi:hypothetical protein